MSRGSAEPQRLPQLFTIGAYGSTADSFFRTLQESEIEMFCDVRARRGVRGSEYAFVNSKRLQARLAELRIDYAHMPEFAPSKELRSVQSRVDSASHIAKRQRTELSELFRRAYAESHLDGFSLGDFLSQCRGARRIVLFCVEREPAACHRSLLANHLATQLGVSVTHLLPKQLTIVR